MENKKKITIVGSGYVGMSLAVLLSKYNEVIVLEIDNSRIKKINEKKSTIEDPDIDIFLEENDLSLKATSNKNLAYKNADFIIVATPTNYDADKNSFDTSSVDGVIEDALAINKNALIVIKSTIPVGHTKILQKRFLSNNIVFSPEFLREGRALKDNLYPSRIIVGSDCSRAIEFATLLQKCALKRNIKTIFMGSTESEAVKLFANSYLAMRVAFFNELDSYAFDHFLDTKSIINGISLDERIGQGYNNPSFGYGGYCLPKDTKQLLANFNQTPQSLMKSIVSSNDIRIKFITDKILELKPKVVGFYRLVMKHGSDNFRSSAVKKIINKLKTYNIEILIYEPTFDRDILDDIKIIKSLDLFKSSSDIIVANRFSEEIDDVGDKLFSRDIFNEN